MAASSNGTALVTLPAATQILITREEGGLQEAMDHLEQVVISPR